MMHVYQCIRLSEYQVVGIRITGYQAIRLWRMPGEVVRIKAVKRVPASPS